MEGRRVSQRPCVNRRCNRSFAKLIHNCSKKLTEKFSNPKISNSPISRSTCLGGSCLLFLLFFLLLLPFFPPFLRAWLLSVDPPSLLELPDLDLEGEKRRNASPSGDMGCFPDDEDEGSLAPWLLFARTVSRWVGAKETKPKMVSRFQSDASSLPAEPGPPLAPSPDSLPSSSRSIRRRSSSAASWSSRRLPPALPVVFTFFPSLLICVSE